jgi:hypothetical protein
VKSATFALSSGPDCRPALRERSYFPKASAARVRSSRLQIRFDYFLRAAFRLGGTRLPFWRASDNPMAIACLRLVTFLPLRPLFSVPRLRSMHRALDVLAGAWAVFSAPAVGAAGAGRFRGFCGHEQVLLTLVLH